MKPTPGQIGMRVKVQLKIDPAISCAEDFEYGLTEVFNEYVENDCPPEIAAKGFEAICTFLIAFTND